MANKNHSKAFGSLKYFTKIYYLLSPGYFLVKFLHLFMSLPKMLERYSAYVSSPSSLLFVFSFKTGIWVSI